MEKAKNINEGQVKTIKVSRSQSETQESYGQGVKQSVKGERCVMQPSYVLCSHHMCYYSSQGGRAVRLGSGGQAGVGRSDC